MANQGARALPERYCHRTFLLRLAGRGRCRSATMSMHKLLAFVISAAPASLAGSTKTVVFQLASLTDAHWHMSGEVILMTLLGGVGTILGPLVAAHGGGDLAEFAVQRPAG